MTKSDKNNNLIWTWFSFYDKDDFIANIFFSKIEDKYFFFDIRTSKPAVRGFLKINPMNLKDFSYEVEVPEHINNSKREEYYVASFEEAISSIKKNKFKTLVSSPVWEETMKSFLSQKGLTWAM